MAGCALSAFFPVAPKSRTLYRESLASACKSAPAKSGMARVSALRVRCCKGCLLRRCPVLIAYYEEMPIVKRRLFLAMGCLLPVVLLAQPAALAPEKIRRIEQAISA